MSNENQFRTLVGELLAMTEAGKLVWHDTPDGNRFITNLKNGLVEIAKREINADGELPELPPFVYELSLLNKQGRVAEQVNSLDLEDAQFAELFSAARSQARGGENLLETFLQELSS